MSTPVSRDTAAKPRPPEPATDRAVDAPFTHVLAAPAPGQETTMPAPLTGEAARLRALSAATRAGRSWDPQRDDLVNARNAHHSNTHQEMRAALAGDHDWLEGDVRLDGDDVPVMAHDRSDEGEGLSFDEWAQVGAAGGRGLKIDVKERAALPQLLDRLERSGVPHGRIMFNVGAIADEQVVEIRRRFPEAWLALNPTMQEDGYHLDDLQQVTRLADLAGGRVTFPVRWDALTDEVIHELARHGKVSVWAAQSEGTPADPELERARLIHRGIDGVIDLGEPQTMLEEALEGLRDAWTSEPLRSGRGLVRDARDLAIDAYSSGKGLVDDGLDMVGDWLG